MIDTYVQTEHWKKFCFSPVVSSSRIALTLQIQTMAEMAFGCDAKLNRSYLIYITNFWFIHTKLPVHIGSRWDSVRTGSKMFQRNLRISRNANQKMNPNQQQHLCLQMRRRQWRCKIEHRVSEVPDRTWSWTLILTDYIAGSTSISAGSSY